MYRWNMCYKTDFTKTGGEKPERSFADHGHKGNAKKCADSTWG